MTADAQERLFKFEANSAESPREALLSILDLLQDPANMMETLLMRSYFFLALAENPYLSELAPNFMEDCLCASWNSSIYWPIYNGRVASPEHFSSSPQMKTTLISFFAMSDKLSPFITERVRKKCHADIQKPESIKKKTQQKDCYSGLLDLLYDFYYYDLIHLFPRKQLISAMHEYARTAMYNNSLRLFVRALNIEPDQRNDADKILLSAGLWFSHTEILKSKLGPLLDEDLKKPDGVARFRNLVKQTEELRYLRLLASPRLDF